jgi:hypothetical protein
MDHEIVEEKIGRMFFEKWESIRREENKDEAWCQFLRSNGARQVTQWPKTSQDSHGNMFLLNPYVDPISPMWVIAIPKETAEKSSFWDSHEQSG